MSAHELKCVPPFWARVADKSKNFEVRRYDRDYQVGDRLVLREWIPDARHIGAGKYTGGVAAADITYVLPAVMFRLGLSEGYCVLALGEVTVTSWPADSGEVTDERG